MKVTALYKIGENYVIGDNQVVYRLPRVINGRQYDLCSLKPNKHGYYIDGAYIAFDEIKYEPIEPFVLVDEKVFPFKV